MQARWCKRLDKGLESFPYVTNLTGIELSRKTLKNNMYTVESKTTTASDFLEGVCIKATSGGCQLEPGVLHPLGWSGQANSAFHPFGVDK